MSLSRNVRTHLIALSASCGTVYCNRSCLFATGGRTVFVVGVWVCYDDNSKLHASILTKLGLYFVGKPNDNLQLIKFWPSRDKFSHSCDDL